jgi:septal ring factor EnvC (AmiA/AmiB activator)
MTDDLEGSGQWRDSVETRLGKLEVTVEEQARLRAAMDEYLGNLKAELGAHKRLIQSIHDTQSDHTARLERLETGQKELRTGLGRVQVGVEAIRDMLDRTLNRDN